MKAELRNVLITGVGVAEKVNSLVGLLKAGNGEVVIIV